MLVHGLAEEVVHARAFCLLLVSFSLVGRDAANERLLLPFHMLIHELLYLHASLNAATLRHAVV